LGRVQGVKCTIYNRASYMAFVVDIFPQLKDNARLLQEGFLWLVYAIVPSGARSPRCR